MDSQRLVFHASDTSAQADEEVADCGFEGDNGYAFAIISEDGSLVRIAWHNGSRGEDEVIIGVTELRLKPGLLSIDFDRKDLNINEVMPYEGVDITYDNSLGREFDLVDVFKQIFINKPDCVKQE